jgi:hypothetical protein
MGLFSKKPDPIAERERMLSEQLAAVEAEIKKLSQLQVEAAQAAPAPVVAPPPPSAPASKAQPRLRSTALPLSHTNSNSSAAAVPNPDEPVFEEIPESVQRLHVGPERGSGGVGHAPHRLPGSLGSDQESYSRPLDFESKLVSYRPPGAFKACVPCATRRVARNRFIVLAAILALLLLGLFAVFSTSKPRQAEGGNPDSLARRPPCHRGRRCGVPVFERQVVIDTASH